jgi:hypothetical protein
MAAGDSGEAMSTQQYELPWWYYDQSFNDGTGECVECGRNLTWGGMGWSPHSELNHAYQRRYWRQRMFEALERLSVK